MLGANFQHGFKMIIITLSALSCKNFAEKGPEGGVSGIRLIKNASCFTINPYIEVSVISSDSFDESR